MTTEDNVRLGYVCWFKVTRDGTEFRLQDHVGDGLERRTIVDPTVYMVSRTHAGHSCIENLLYMSMLNERQSVAVWVEGGAVVAASTAMRAILETRSEERRRVVEGPDQEIVDDLFRRGREQREQRQRQAEERRVATPPGMPRPHPGSVNP
jgi:hypothetical protein